MGTTTLIARTATGIDHKTGLTDLVAGARIGCASSWREIVGRYNDYLRRVARARGLDATGAGDAVQQTWMVAFMNIDALRDAQALGGWLHRILHRECLKELRLRSRETPRIDEIDPSRSLRNGRAVMMHTEPCLPEQEALRVEQLMLMQMARRRLPSRDQELLTLLSAEPRLSYTEISRRLGMPAGSIGPTRARCLTRLRHELAALGVRGE